LGKTFQSVDPDIISCNTGEQFTETFTFYGADGELNLSTFEDLVVTLSVAPITKEASTIASPKLPIQFTPENLYKEILSNGSFKLQWVDNGDTVIEVVSPVSLVVINPNDRLSIMDIRDELWDVFSENKMHDGFEFDDHILMDAKMRSFEMWGGSVASDRNYTTKSFPERWLSRWRRGAAGQALLLKSRQLMGNMFPYQAEGLSVQDLEQRMQFYQELGQQLVEEWRRFIRHIHAINVIKYSGGRIG